MTYGAKLNIALAVALAAMLVVAWLMQRDAEHLQPRLAKLDYTEVSTLRIELPDREALAFERVGERWVMRAPVELDVDVRRIEEIVNALSVPSLARYPARDLQLVELGLGESPKARVIVDGEAYILGDANPVNRLRYVQRGEVVHLVNDLLYFRLSGQPHGWVHRQPLPPGSRIARIEAGDFVIERTEDGWAVTQGDTTASVDSVQRVVDAWANAHAFQVVKWEGPMPFENVAQVWLDGRDQPLGFILRMREEEMAVIRPDLEIEYKLPRYRAEDLWMIPTEQD